MLFAPSDILTRLDQKIDESFYAKLNGEPPHKKLSEPMFLAGTGPLPLTNVGVSGVIMPLFSRKEPVPFHRVVDQFQRIQDRLTGRNPNIFNSNLRFFG